MSGRDPDTSARPPFAGRRRVRLAITGALTVGLIAALAWSVEPERVARALVSADLALLGVAVLCAVLLDTLHSAVVYRAVLASLGLKVSHRACLLATVGSMGLQAALPGGTGNFGRAVYLARVEGCDAGRASAGVLGLLWFKLVAQLVVSAVAWVLLAERNPVHGALVLPSAAAAIGAVIVAPRLARWANKRFGGTSGVGKAVRAIASAAGTVDPPRVGVAMFQAALNFIGEMVIFTLLLHAVGANVSPVAVAAFFPLIVIGAKVPLTVFGLGTREVLTVTLLAGTGAPEHLLLAAGLLWSVVGHLLPAGIGALVTWSFIRRIVEAGAGRDQLE